MNDAAQKHKATIGIIIVVIIALEQLMALPIGSISPATAVTTANHSKSIETMFHLMKPRCLNMSRYK
jgi:hypothetical protein